MADHEISCRYEVMTSTNRPSLVLLPGLDGTGMLFQPLVGCLPDGIRPIVVSYPNDARLGYRDLLPIVLDSLPASPFVLLGESFSGPLAVMAATTKPPGLRGVVLCATFVRSPVAYLPSWFSHMVRPFPLRFYPMFARLRMLLGRFSDPAVRSLTVQAVSMVGPDVVARRIREVHRIDVAAQLESCPVPVLYLRGDRDRLVPASAMRAILNACPAAEVVSFPAPHMILQTHPAAAARAISDFVQSMCSGEGPGRPEDRISTKPKDTGAERDHSSGGRQGLEMKANVDEP